MGDWWQSVEDWWATYESNFAQGALNDPLSPFATPAGGVTDQSLATPPPAVVGQEATTLADEVAPSLSDFFSGAEPWAIGVGAILILALIVLLIHEVDLL